MNINRIAIIGAGITGLSCAARLKKAGLEPVVLDKGRGIGGRSATRRTENGFQFDHGAQYVEAGTEKFLHLLTDAERAGFVKKWDFGNGNCYVGSPGMNGLPRYLGNDLDIRQQVEITAIKEVQDGIELMAGDKCESFHKVLVTVPAPQVIALVGRHHPLSKDIAEVEMLPCMTLMAAFGADTQVSFKARRDPDDPLSWIALDSSKPDRATENCWVAQANPDWSSKHLEDAPEETAQNMLSLLCDRIGVGRSTAIHATAHRWRYSAVSKPLGRLFIHNTARTLYVGGDWCLDSRIEAAWISGNAIAENVLAAY